MSKKTMPPQTQNLPGAQHKMFPKPISIYDSYKPSGKLQDKVALISGGDSGIGRAVAYHFAAEGANIIFTYLNEQRDADHTSAKIAEFGVECMSFPGDLGTPENCKNIAKQGFKRFKRLDCLVNNIAEQHSVNDLLSITPEQLESTFKTNIFSYFYLTQAVLPYLKSGGTIINSTSVTAYRGSKHLIDYAATKGAIVSFTRSLAQNLIEKNIRVNAVAPGPVWTPLIPASFSAEEVAKFGSQTPMQKPAQPADVAPCYVFLATGDSCVMTGQVLHPNSGEIING